MNFSSPAAIQANMVYIVSFSTDGGYFGISTRFFTSAEFSNGPLTALANGASGGDGVSQSAGDFPNVSGSGMNSWVDVAFSPTSSTNARVGSSETSPGGAGGIAPTRTTGRSRFGLVPPSAAAPTGPASFLAGSRGTPTAAGGGLTTFLGSGAPRRTVPQGAPLGSSRLLGFLSWGSGGA